MYEAGIYYKINIHGNVNADLAANMHMLGESGGDAEWGVKRQSLGFVQYDDKRL